MRSLGVAACLGAALWLAGCAQMPMGTPIPSIENIHRAKASGMAPVALGTFALAPALPAGLDRSVSVRSNTVFSPYGSSFSRHLRESLAAELAAAGVLDAASQTVIDAWLTDSRIDAPSGQSQARLAARFVVKRAGAVAYDKELAASARWDSPFAAVVSVPMAIDEYALLYRKLIAMLLDDPAFRAAAKP